MTHSFSKWLAVTVLTASSLQAGNPVDREPAVQTQRVPGAEWVTVGLAQRDALAAEPADGRIPAILLETTPGYVFRANESVSLRLTHDPKGLRQAATLYLYRQNRVTGAREYYNVPAKGFLAAGEQRDLFASGAAPLPVNLPKLENFVLFGADGALGAALPVGSTPAGRYQFVLEVRDAEGKQLVSRGGAMYSVVNGIEEISGEITSNRTLTADKSYFLRGTVFVRPPATLTIEKGTVVYFQASTTGALVIDRGAKIIADGTAAQPIILTSEKPVGQRGFGDSGGLVINGRASINIPGGEAPGEGSTGTYGGGATPNDDDSSGVLRYVRVEFGGYRFTPDNEFNGIAFQGVGRGTVVDHVQVHNAGDDGFEFFGGTVNATYLISTANGDDNLDWVEGWRGTVQFAVVQQRPTGDADTGIEADNKDTNNDLLPRSNPSIYNVTFVGQPGQTGGSSRNAMVIRRGTAGKIVNTVAVGFREAMVAIRDASTFAQGASGDLVIDNNIFALNTAFGAGGYETNANGTSTKAFLETTMKSNRFTDPQLTDPYEPIMPNWQPRPGSPVWDARFVRTPPDNGALDADVDFVGGVGRDNWPLAGWAAFPRS